MLIAREGLSSLLSFNRHRGNLSIKSPAMDSLLGTLLRAKRVLVLLFARDVVLARQHFGGFAHHHLRHWTEKTVPIHAVYKFLVAQAVSPARPIEVVRQTRHRLRSANKHTVHAPISNLLEP